MFLKLINLIPAASALSLFTTGCASVISGNAQSIYVTTECRGRSMPAACTATNDQGSWRFNTPANMLIKKSSEWRSPKPVDTLHNAMDFPLT